jgi:hypothetical protein
LNIKGGLLPARVGGHAARVGLAVLPESGARTLLLMQFGSWLLLLTRLTVRCFFREAPARGRYAAALPNSIILNTQHERKTHISNEDCDVINMESKLTPETATLLAFSGHCVDVDKCLKRNDGIKCCGKDHVENVFTVNVDGGDPLNVSVGSDGGCTNVCAEPNDNDANCVSLY